MNGTHGLRLTLREVQLVHAQTALGRHKRHVKLDDWQVAAVRELLDAGKTTKEIAAKFLVTPPTINNIRRRVGRFKLIPTSPQESQDE